MTYRPGTCVMPHAQDPDRPRAALGGLLLCAGHHRSLVELLGDGRAPGELAGLYGALATVLHPRRQIAGTQSFVTVDTSGDVDMRVVELRHQVVHDLAWWARAHVEELATAEIPASAQPAVLSMWLGRYADWSAAQPFIDEYLGVLQELAGRARSAYDLPQIRRSAWVGQCVETVDGEPCAGALYSHEYGRDSDHGNVIACDTCRVEYAPAQWVRLGRRVGKRLAATG